MQREKKICPQDLGRVFHPSFYENYARSITGLVRFSDKMERQTKLRECRSGSSHEAGIEQSRSLELCLVQELQMAFYNGS